MNMLQRFCFCVAGKRQKEGFAPQVGLLQGGGAGMACGKLAWFPQYQG